MMRMYIYFLCVTPPGAGSTRRYGQQVEITRGKSPAKAALQRLTRKWVIGDPVAID